VVLPHLLGSALAVRWDWEPAPIARPGAIVFFFFFFTAASPEGLRACVRCSRGSLSVAPDRNKSAACLAAYCE